MTAEDKKICDRKIEDLMNKILSNTFYPLAVPYGRLKACANEFNKFLSEVLPHLLGVVVFEEYINDVERYIITYKALPRGYKVSS